tara:strand:- start:381 stop:956 length:576 start_codon:yes stop_codon:yes gene_type:complete
VGNTKHDGSPTPTVKGSIGEASKHNTQGQKKTSQSERASEPRNSGGVEKSSRTTDVADTDSLNRGAVQEPQRRQKENSIKRQSPSNSSSDVAYTDSKLGETQHQRSVLGKQNTEGSARGHSDEGLQGNWQWLSEPRMGGMVNGISTWLDEPRDTPRVSTKVPNRAKRLKGLGNAIIPQIAMRIGQTIKEVM